MLLRIVLLASRSPSSLLVINSRSPNFQRFNVITQNLTRLNTRLQHALGSAAKSSDAPKPESSLFAEPAITASGKPPNRRTLFKLYEYMQRRWGRGKQLNGELPVKIASPRKRVTLAEAKRFWSIALPERNTIFAAATFLGLSSAVTMSIPYAVGRIIDTISNSSAEQMVQLKEITTIMLAVFIVGALANFCRVYFINRASQRITASMRRTAFTSIMSKSASFFRTERNRSGELSARLSLDCWIVGSSLTQNVSDGLRAVISAGVGTGMMVYASPSLSLVGMLTVPPVAAVGIIYGAKIKQITAQVQDELARASQLAEERIANIKVVQYFARQSRDVQLYSQRVEDVLFVQKREALAKAAFFGFAGLSGNFLVLSVLYYGGWLMHDGQITVGQLSAFLMYAALVGVGLSNMSQFYAELMKGIGASQRLWAILDHPTPIQSGSYKPATANDVQGLFEMRNVTFQYEAAEAVENVDIAVGADADTEPEQLSKPSDAVNKPTLMNLNLQIRPGEFVAIVGPSGSGKTTILSLFMRLYDPQAGEIRLDGVDLRQYDLDFLRRKVMAIVPQEPVLFAGNVMDNIAYGLDEGSRADGFNNSVVSESSLQKIRNAAAKANALDFIERLPRGFQTPVGERGTQISGGQKQRLAIARALAKEPRIILMDEATSSLDAESEQRVQASIQQMVHSKNATPGGGGESSAPDSSTTKTTVIIVAHRLSTIVQADRILVLNNGSIAEQGSYSELMRMPDGVFRKMMKKQTLNLV